LKGKKDLKVLFLSSRVPYPPVGGDRLKNYWLLKILSKHFDVHLVTIAEEDPPEEFYNWLKALSISSKVFKMPKRRFLKNALRGLFSSLPIQVSYYFFPEVKRYILDIYKEYDLVFSTLIRTALYAKSLPIPRILDMADSIGLNYKNSAKRTSSIFWKFVYTLESRRLLKFEKECVDSFDKTLFFNPFEREYFKSPKKTAWIPHGVNEELLVYEDKDERYKNFVAFFGKMDYQPNIDAVLWFVENVLPLLDEKIGFVIVGARPAKKILKLQEKNKRIKVTGFVKDPYKILKGCLCVVAPMQTGGGIQNKVLECMALGTINIVSSKASVAIAAQDKKDFFVIDSPRGIAKKIHEIFENPLKFEYIKKNARNFIKKHFTWSIYEKNLLKIIDEVVNDYKSKSTA